MRALIGALLLLLTIYTLVTTATRTERDRRVIECQTELNAQYADAIKQSRAAATDERAAQRVFLTTVSDPQVTAAARAQAYTAYLTALQVADDKRDNAPLPSRSRCG